MPQNYHLSNFGGLARLRLLSWKGWQKRRSQGLMGLVKCWLLLWRPLRPVVFIRQFHALCAEVLIKGLKYLANRIIVVFDPRERDIYAFFY